MIAHNITLFISIMSIEISWVSFFTARDSKWFIFYPFWEENAFAEHLEQHKSLSCWNNEDFKERWLKTITITVLRSITFVNLLIKFSFKMFHFNIIKEQFPQTLLKQGNLIHLQWIFDWHFLSNTKFIFLTCTLKLKYKHNITIKIIYLKQHI